MRMKRTVVFVAAVVFCAAASLRAQSLPDLVVHYADIVLYNGKVHTVDKGDPTYSIVQAVAIRDGKFLAVGDSKTILTLAGPQTLKIDLAGRSVTPGFVDTHSHQMEYAKIPRPVMAQNGRFRLPVRDPAQKAAALAEIEAFAKTRTPGAWIATATSNDMVRALTLAEMDRVAPNNPMYVSGTPSYGCMNSKGLEELLKRYPNIEGVQRGPDGKPTGQVETPIMGVVDMELIPPYPLETRIEAYKREMDRWVGAGITTFSSRLYGHEVEGYVNLERRGLELMRLGYSSGWLMDNPNWKAFIQRIGDTIGLGDDLVWNIGLSITSVDGTLGDNCVSIEKKIKAGSSGALGDCRALPGMVRFEAVKGALEAGIRVSGVHAAGDRGIDALLDMLIELKKQGVAVDKLRPAVDHCLMVSAQNIKKAAQVPGFIFSCAPKYIIGESGTNMARIWDKEIPNNWLVPMNNIMDAGVKVAWEVDSGEVFGETQYPIFQPMYQMQAYVTRSDDKGNIWGQKQSLDRKKALILMTRGGAEYVLREDRIGSIEPGKLADLAIFDGDFLGVPDNRLSDLSVLMTLVGGKVVYSDPTFAGTLGPQLKRVLHPHAAQYPAYKPGANMHSKDNTD